MWIDGPYTDVGLLRDISDSLNYTRSSKIRPSSREREPKDKVAKKKAATKMKKASRRRNRR